MSTPAAAARPARDRPDWRDQAACRDADPELFFPDGDTGSAQGPGQDGQADLPRLMLVYPMTSAGHAGPGRSAAPDPFRRYYPVQPRTRQVAGADRPPADPPEVPAMTTTGEPEIAVPDLDTPAFGDGPAYRRILVPVRLAEDALGPLAVVARVCSAANCTVRLVHVRIYDPPMRGSGRFYPQNRTDAAAIPDDALPMAWGYGLRATAAVAEAPRRDVASVVAPAVGRLARRPDRHDPAPGPCHLPPHPWQRARPGHAQSALPGARCPSGSEGSITQVAAGGRRKTRRAGRLNIFVRHRWA